MAKCARCDDHFTRGVAWAIATTYMQHDNGVACADLVMESGLSLKDFKAAGVDPYDMKYLRKLFKSEPRLIRRFQSDRPEKP